MPETVRKRWASVLPVMQGGALLLRSARDGLFYAGDGWGGLDEEDLRILVGLGLLRAIGDAYVVGLAAAAPPAPMEAVYPAITVFQPWATLVAEDAKPWEFRTRRPPDAFLGRRVAIHASARPVRVREVKELLVRLQTGRASLTALVPDRAIEVLEAMLRAPEAVTLKAVVCTAVLGEPLLGRVLGQQLGVRDEVLDSDRRKHALWAWPLTRVERLVLPAPATGKQGWWYWQAR